MRIEQLEYIVSVAETHSFSKTAQLLHVSQPAISQSILKLEMELGVDIFERTPQGVSPTSEGKVLIQNAADVLLQLKLLKENAQKFRSSDQNELKIGLVTGLHLPFLPTILSQLRMEFPYQRITFKEIASIEIVESIIKKELDIGILAIYENTLKHQNIINFQNLYEVSFFIFVNKDSPLASYDFITPQQLKNYTFVMYNGEFMNWFFDKFNDQFGPFEILLRTNNNETISETVRNGLAITIETEAELLNNRYIKTGELIPIPLIDHIPNKSYLGLAKTKNRALSTETKTFIKSLESYMKEMFHSKTV
ncbi:LysR family transcriptional regulator [Sporosarcina sp. 179-K 3D1 HS]|uniref:LysR family transcriptional regulator n=1 Tax=Sporosarcina sp. 179-K 3D1 HS TaxID=3232169 RepID=UPI0039A0A87F